MPGEDIESWSTTAANNASADSSINWAEGQARASVNDSARSMMAAIAKDRNLKNGSITTGGTANAQTFTSGRSYTAVPTGLRVLLKIGVTNTASATLNMDGIGGVTIKDMFGDNISAGALVLGSYVEFRFDGTNWIVIGGAAQSGALVLLSTVTASSSATVDFTSGITDLFDEYQIKFSNVTPATGANAFWMRVSRDSGATFLSGTSYRYAIAQFHDLNSVPSQSGTSSAPEIPWVNGAWASDPTLGGVNGTVCFYKPASTSANVNFMADYTSYNSTSGLQRWIAVGACKTTGTSAVNGVRFLASSGALATGSFALYGVRS